MANKLHCEAKDCLHNADEKCSADIIQVNGGATDKGRDTYCNSYVNTTDTFVNTAVEHMKCGNIGNGRTDTEFGNDITAFTTPRITCTAGKCEYNVKYYCHAKDVEIAAPKESSIRCECRTFRPK